MKIATILPTKYLHLEEGADYHLCLAHHLLRDYAYTEFFRRQSDEGKFVIMDNGAAENGRSLPISDLLELAEVIRPSEIVLPDVIDEPTETLCHSLSAWIRIRDSNLKVRTMMVPQGRTSEEWTACALAMLASGTDTIGISKFIVPTLFPSRAHALMTVPPLIASKVDIHLLGCPTRPIEAIITDGFFQGRIRGIDSGIASIYAQNGRLMSDHNARPIEPIDLFAEPDETLLKENIAEWKAAFSYQEIG